MRKHLGELALRTNDLGRLVAFYRDVVGLEIFDDTHDGLVFLRIDDLTDGHPQILGIFDRGMPVGQPSTTLDHLAFVVDLSDLDTEHERLAAAGVDVFPKTFPFFGWRSIFFSDPDGNTVEFVAADPAVRHSSP